ncbi:pilus assembly protein [Streptomyces sp. DSM 44915]|uniref:Pilus assembly protein n=1 Tax=Streptomyces chisholmiae TaxID=3075540 RepID=A0ABU2JUQ2_9ACTN|nr:pilus assembly protein [Streptomyces sp. DSM 44915]MDT0267938.1 pilus assembly protein [Streptomyces sp. DSM 44915]
MIRRLGGFLRRRVAQGADRGGSVLRAGDRGGSAIEFLFLTPVMFFMIFGAVQFALYSFAEHVAKAAAQAGARTARAQADADPAGWRVAAEAKAHAYVTQLGPGLFTGPPDVVTSQPGAFTVRVEVEGKVPSIMPGMNLTVSAASEGPVERFVPDGG